MAKKDNVMMPSSGAGITRYFGDVKSKIEIAPGHVIIMCVVVAIIILVLHQFGKGWLGLP